MDPARDRRGPQQDAPRAELRGRRAPRRRDDAVPALRPARARASCPGACRCSGASRPASSARSRRGTRRRVLGMRVVAPALAVGNAVILKPDPQTPVCGGAMFEAVFREAGLPEGLLHVVLGGAEVGEAIVTDPNVTRVSFTGSTAAGRRVGALAGELLKRVSLELGGNNAFVVLDDADLEAAASAGAFASFQFQGQVCFATGPPHRPPQRRRGVHRPARREGAAPPARRPVPRGRRPRADRQPEAARARRRHRPPVGRGRRPRRRRRHARGPVLPPDRAHRRHHRPGGVARGDLRPGRAGGRVRHRRGGARARERQRVRADRRRLLALDLARPRARPAVPLGHGPRQRPDGERRGDDPVRRHGRVRHGPLRRPGQLGRVHRVAVGDRARRARAPTRSRTERGDDGIDHRGRAARRRVGGDRVARRLRVRLPGQRRDPRAGPRGRPDARLRPERARPRPAQEPGAGRRP